MEVLVLGWSTFTLAIIVALVFGGRVERLGALVLVGMGLIALVGREIHPAAFHEVDPVSATEDIFAFLAFTYLGISSRKVWPLWASAFQLISVGAHFVRAFELDVRPFVYAWMKSGPTWGVFVLIIAGSLLHRRSFRDGQ